jgi:hypothetical protein
MERKGGNTAVVTKEQVTTALKTATLTSREEQALRMRYGAAFDMKAPLPQAHGGDQGLADELLLIEMQLLKGLKAHRGLKATAATKGAVKSKIAARLGKK